MKKCQFEAVLFDLDGTLIDTEPSAAEAVNDCFSKWNIQVSAADANYVTGRTWDSAFEFLFNKYTIPVKADEAKKMIKDQYRITLEKHLITVPGGAQTVRSLHENIALGLISGSSRRDILWALDKLEIRELFQTILGAEDYSVGKPSPEGYLKAAKILKVDPKSCLVFEDSRAGIQAAREAGMYVVAITSTNHSHQDNSQAHLKIQDLTQVNYKWVEGLIL